LDLEVCDNEHEKKVVDLKFEQTIGNMMHFLEIFNAHDFAQNEIPLVKQENFVSVLDLTYEKQEVECFMYSPLDCYERKFVNHFIQEQVDIPSIFLVDDTIDFLGEPTYDEYNDDYEIVSSKQLAATSSLEIDCFQQFQDKSQGACHGQVVEDGDTNPLISDLAMYPLPVEFSLQHFKSEFQPLFDSYQLDLNVSEDVVEEQIHVVSFGQCYEDSLFSYNDPFATCLETVRRFKISDFLNIEIISRFLSELLLSGSFILLLNEYMQGMQQAEKTLAWLH